MHHTWEHTVPEWECVYIRQSTSACVITTILHFWHSKNLPNPKSTAQLRSLYSKIHWQWLWEVFLTLYKVSNVSMTYPIAVILIKGLYSHWYDICFKAFIAISDKQFYQLVSNCIFCVCVKTLRQVHYVKLCMRHVLIKHEAKLSALIACRLHTECFTLHNERALYFV